MLWEIYLFAPKQLNAGKGIEAHKKVFFFSGRTTKVWVPHQTLVVRICWSIFSFDEKKEDFFA